MGSNRLVILAVAAAVAIGLVALLASQRAPEPEGSLLAGPVLPGLAERLNQVATVRIVQAGDQPLLTLARSDDGWTVAERDGYPANAGKVRTALLNLAESKVVEQKTANAERYAQLGVEDVDTESATGVRIELTGEDVQSALIVGNYAGQQGEGTYVRRVGEAQSLMAAGNLVPERQVGDWLRRELTDIASSRIQQVELVEGDGRPLRVFKDSPEDGNFQVADVPRGRTLQSEVVANGLGSTLAGLTLDDVARAGGPAPAQATRHRATYTLFDGLVLALDGYQEPADAEGNAGAAWISITASLDRERALARIAQDIAAEQAAAQADADAAAAAAASAPDAGGPVADSAEGAPSQPSMVAEGGSDAVADAAEPAQAPAPAPIDVEARTAERLAAVQAQVDELNARLGGWRFLIPAFKYSTIDKSIDDLLQPVDG